MGNDLNRGPPRMSTHTGWSPRVLAVIAATGLALYVCYLLAYPFFPAITWAAALAVVTYPLQDRIAKRIKSPNLAAGLAVAVIALVVVAPGLFVAERLGGQAGHAVEALRAKTQSGQWLATMENRPALARAVRWIEPYLDMRSLIEQAANAIGSYISSFVGGSVWIMAQLLITFFTLYYLLRDRRMILSRAKSMMPLPAAETDKLFSRVSDTIYATFYGTFVVALVQGLLGGLMFWWLDLPAPLFFGMVMALVALIPVLGPPVVWIPMAIFLALTGNFFKALVLTAWGVIVVGTIDNLLYPMLVGDKMHMHTLLVFFSVVGGVAVLGTSGLILGPVAVVVTYTLIEAWQGETN